LGAQAEQGGLNMLLVVVDTTQIQPYIFGSNRLRENVGASYLVDAATRTWAFDAVRKAVNGAAPGETNIGPNNEIQNKGIEQGLAAEVLYAGGGNFAVLFGTSKAEEFAKQFNSNLSRRALLEAPGLQLVIAQQAMQWGQEFLRDKLDDVFRVLAIQKKNRAWSAPLLGLGVTASCNSTGLPATGLVPGIGGELPYLASDEIQAKVEVAWPQGREGSAADQRLKKAIALEEAYAYPRDFDDMGATAGEYSYIAIVHADGNSMGQRIREIKISDALTMEDKNREFVRELRRFSLDVEKAAKAALNEVRARLVRCIVDKDGKKVIVHQLNQKMSIQIELAKSKEGKYYVPFRPIVFGGDDVTFVCDGRLGLSLAIEYLREFEHQTQLVDSLRKDGSGLTACAGVAIVKSHYPFARAYSLAEDLCASAKRYRREKEIDGSCLDWHFALSGLSGSLKEVRDREYQASAGSLTLRPVTLAANPKQVQRSWLVIEKGIDAFQKDWAGHHNKIKALRDVLREGPAAVERFVEAVGSELPAVLPKMSDWPKKGWHGDSCGYFDAIELADWFIPLKGEADAATATTS
jgi:hypothetical protein